MSILAQELDHRMSLLPPDKREALQSKVRSLLDTTGSPWSEGTELTSKGWPKGWLKSLAEQWGAEPFEAPEELREEALEE